MGSRPSRAIPKAVKMVLVAPLLTLATKGLYQEDTRLAPVLTVFLFFIVVVFLLLRKTSTNWPKFY